MSSIGPGSGPFEQRHWVGECLVGVSAVWPEGGEWEGSSGRLG